jgi:hypothetical protein
LGLEKPDFSLRKKLGISGGRKFGGVDQNGLLTGDLNLAWVDRETSQCDKKPFI